MKTIVISDIHLGIDDHFAENVKNRGLLISFLEKVRREKAADEIVINGDFLDQWFLPGSYDHVTESDAFYRQVAANNKDVIEAFSAVIKDGLRLVYVPGNHDMTLTHGTLASILPGIRQSRDVRGLGRYRTGERGEIVIEHGHRYESFCAPDPVSNRAYMKYGEPILPPGYLFALVGVQGMLEGHHDVPKKVPEIPKPDQSDRDQTLAYGYYALWKYILDDLFPVKEAFDEKFIKVNVDGFQGLLSLADIVPVQTRDGISAPLYSHMQRNWDEIQRRNLVPAQIDLTDQFARMFDQTLRAEYARKQYFDLDPTVDVVVFGHTHVPFYQEYKAYDRTKLYVNEGTWIDKNMDDPENTASFAWIDSSADATKVELLKCVGDGKLEDIIPVKNKYVQK